jgi:Domain of unknown function (DUF4189)
MYIEYNDHTIADDRSRKLPILLLLLGALALLAAMAYWVLNNRHNQVTAAAPGVYGAIATSQSSLDFGGAWGYSDPAAAVRRALTECNARVAHADCVARVSLNNNCAALVVSPVRKRQDPGQRPGAGAMRRHRRRGLRCPPEFLRRRLVIHFS